MRFAPSLVFALALLGSAMAQAPKSIYIDTRLPNAHPMKKELLDKLRGWGKITVVNLPEQGDLILQLDQTERLLSGGGNGNRGRAVLKDRLTGEELWSEEKGGGWQMSGWSAGAVGGKLGSDLVKFLSKNEHGSKN